MQDKRRWLPAWQRVELVELCLDRGCLASPGRGLATRERRRRCSTGSSATGPPSEAERASGAWAQDRPSTPHRQPAGSATQVHDRVCEARERTGWGPRLIASELGHGARDGQPLPARAAACRAGRRRRASAVRRFEWPCPGDLLQMDTKRLARFTRPGHAVTGDRYRTGAEKRSGVGWEFCHSIIDDHSRLAYTEIHPDEQAATVTALRRARAGVLRRPRHHARGGCRPTTPGPTSTTARCASCSPSAASSTAGSRRARPSATARSSATSRPSPANGPTGSATATQPPAPPRCPSGSSTTTTPATTAHSQTGHPSAAFGTSRGTTPRSGPSCGSCRRSRPAARP